MNYSLLYLGDRLIAWRQFAERGLAERWLGAAMDHAREAHGVSLLGLVEDTLPTDADPLFELYWWRLGEEGVSEAERARLEARALLGHVVWVG